MSLPWIDLAPGWSKWQWSVLNLILTVLLFLRPNSRPRLIAAGLGATAAQLAWHSWLGAFPPWIPVVLVGLAVFSHSGRGELSGAVTISLLIVFLGTAIHRLNPVYLSGLEFRPEGMFAKLFPEAVKDGLSRHSDLAAKLWLVFSLVPVGLIVAGRAFGAAVAIAAVGLAACFLYPVLFYGLFLLTPLLLTSNPGMLDGWRGVRNFRIKPLHIYLLSMAGFFGWYLWFRDVTSVYWLTVGLGAVSVGAARADWEGFLALPGSVTWRQGAWSAGLALYLLAPLVFTEIPAPFGGTYFSARTHRYPASHWSVSPASSPDCGTLKKEYALRWGYRLRTLANGQCEVATYR